MDRLPHEMDKDLVSGPYRSINLPAFSTAGRAPRSISVDSSAPSQSGEAEEVDTHQRPFRRTSVTHENGIEPDEITFVNKSISNGLKRAIDDGRVEEGWTVAAKRASLDRRIVMNSREVQENNEEVEDGQEHDDEEESEDDEEDDSDDAVDGSGQPSISTDRAGTNHPRRRAGRKPKTDKGKNFSRAMVSAKNARAEKRAIDGDSASDFDEDGQQRKKAKSVTTDGIGKENGEGSLFSSNTMVPILDTRTIASIEKERKIEAPSIVKAKPVKPARPSYVMQEKLPVEETSVIIDGPRGGRRRAAQAAMVTIKKAVGVKKMPVKKKTRQESIYAAEIQSTNFQLIIFNDPTAAVVIRHLSASSLFDTPSLLKPISVLSSSNSTRVITSYLYALPTDIKRPVDGLLKVYIETSSKYIIDESILLGLGHGDLKVEYRNSKNSRWAVRGGAMRVLERGEC
jgi:hypothetical protein